MRVLLYAKMLKETETEETKNFLSLVAFQLGEGGWPLGYAYGYDIFLKLCDILSQSNFFLSCSAFLPNFETNKLA